MEKLFIIKIGGNVIDHDAALSAFLKDLAGVSEKVILIHGGGKIASTLGKSMGIEPLMVKGRRITDDKTLDLVTMVYAGLINKKIVARLQALQRNAIGLTGVDGNIIPATKRPVKEIDYGFAGDPQETQIGTPFLQDLLESGMLPVIAPITHDTNGQLLNTNADTIASVLAVAMSALYRVRLVYCFEKRGVLNDITDEQSVIPLITEPEFEMLKKEDKLADGILPKLDNAFHALHAGVKEVLIGHSDDIVRNCTENTAGTLIRL